MLNEHRNTKKQGDEGLGAAIAYFTSVGDCVNVPLTDSQEYDLVVDRNGTLYRIQVKTTTFKRSDNYYVSLTVKGGNRTASGKIKSFDKMAVDYVFVDTPESQYLIPSQALGNSATLGRRYEIYRL